MGIAASVLAMLGAWELMPESGMRLAGARGVDASPLAYSPRYAMAPVPNSEPEGLPEQKQRPGLRWVEEKSVEAHDLALRRGGAVSTASGGGSSIRVGVGPSLGSGQRSGAAAPPPFRTRLQRRWRTRFRWIRRVRRPAMGGGRRRPG